jgi:hypothetical protein
VWWDSAGTIATELGNLGTSSGGFAENIAYAVNDADIAVGYAQKYDLSGTLLGTRAVAWGDSGTAIDLNTLLSTGDDPGWANLRTACGISNTNWITGIGVYDPDGTGGLAAYDRMFLLDASSLVPEPASLSLLVLGAATRLWRRRAFRRVASTDL